MGERWRWRLLPWRLGRRAVQNEALNQLEVWRAAEVLIRRYDERAIDIATERGKKFLKAGDMERYAAACQVAEIIYYLQHGRPRPDENSPRPLR